MMKRWHKQVKSNSDVLKEITKLPFDTRFAELEDCEQVQLIECEKSAIIFSDTTYRGHVFGTKGQLEFRFIDNHYLLVVLAEENCELNGWTLDCDFSDVDERDYLLENNPEGFKKATISVFRDTDHNIQAVWWKELKI